MRTPSSRTAKIAAAAATPVAVIAASALIWQSSYAAFSGSTRNSGNDWSTGSLTLTDDDSGTSRFQVTNMVPGATDTKCIKITANASVPGTVKGFVVNPVPSPQGLENYIKVTVRGGTGGGFNSCAGFVPDGANPVVPGYTLAQLATSTTYASAIGGWPVVAGTQSRTYEISYTFDVGNMSTTQVDALQGAHTGIDFQWELQSS